MGVGRRESEREMGGGGVERVLWRQRGRGSG